LLDAKFGARSCLFTARSAMALLAAQVALSRARAFRGDRDEVIGRALRAARICVRRNRAW
jgi:hypothetical protein